MWLSVDEFKTRTNISSYQDQEIEDILLSAKQTMEDYIFIFKRIKVVEPREYQMLEMDNLYIADSMTYDGEINLNNDWELNIFEVDKDYNEYNLNSHITVFKHKYGRVEFDTKLPTSDDREMYIEYYLGIKSWDNIYNKVKDLQLLVGIRDTLQNKPTAAQSLMAGSWSLNGVSIDSGATNMETVYNSLTLQINRMIKELQPLRISARDLRPSDQAYTYYRM